MLGTTEIEVAMASLARWRPVFHSEADFQFALAWRLQELHPNINIRLEYPVPLEGERGAIDVWLHDAIGAAVIELKYWTWKASLNVKEEPFLLKDQSRRVWARYDFWKDVARTETLIGKENTARGYVIALSNDEGHWKPAGDGSAADEAFRLFEGRVVGGTLDWGPSAGRGTRRGREVPHSLVGHYEMRWQNYSNLASGKGGQFRYLLLDVGAGIAKANA